MTSIYLLFFSKENALLFMESLLGFDVVKLLYIFLTKALLVLPELNCLPLPWTLMLLFRRIRWTYKQYVISYWICSFSWCCSYICVCCFVLRGIRLNLHSLGPVVPIIISFFISLKSCYYCMNFMTCCKTVIALVDRYVNYCWFYNTTQLLNNYW